MHALQLTTTGLLALTLFVTVPSATAGWSLDDEHSHVSFVSIKAKDIGEVNKFQEIAGQIDDDGQIEVTLNLDSVETLIPIRNERMRKFLFETSDYKVATLRAKVEPDVIDAMAVGSIERLDAEGQLVLHGTEQSIILRIQATRPSEDKIMASALEPVIVDASKFGLDDGVEKLREIAGLESISNAVPVTFVMTFVKGD